MPKVKPEAPIAAPKIQPPPPGVFPPGGGSWTWTGTEFVPECASAQRAADEHAAAAAREAEAEAAAAAEAETPATPGVQA